MAAFRAGAQVGAALVVSLLAPPRPARAVEARHITPGVRFSPPACPIAPVALPTFVEALRVELTGRAPEGGATLVSLAVEPCDTSTNRVQVSVSDDASGRGAARDIDLADVALDARPRALALAVAELVHGVLPPPAPPPPPPPPPPEPTPVVAAPPTGALVAIDAHALLQLYPTRDTQLWGGRVSVSGVRGRWQHGGFGEFVSGQRSFAEGRVELFSLGIGGFVGPHWTWSRVALSPGVAASVAWSRAEGRATAPGVVASSGSAPTAAVRARLAAALLMGRALSLSAIVEAGYVVRSFDATVDGSRATGVSGASLVFGLGLGFGP